MNGKVKRLTRNGKEKMNFLGWKKGHHVDLVIFLGLFSKTVMFLRSLHEVIRNEVPQAKPSRLL